MINGCRSEKFVNNGLAARYYESQAAVLQEASREHRAEKWPKSE